MLTAADASGGRLTAGAVIVLANALRVSDNSNQPQVGGEHSNAHRDALLHETLCEQSSLSKPYESPATAGNKPPSEAARPYPRRDLPSFFAWYFGAFILAALLWHLSAFVRKLDFLELPMAALYFPLAGFFDPHDGMVNDRTTFFYAIAFWGAVVPVVLRLTPKRISPLVLAFAINVSCSVASVVYAVFRAWAAESFFCSIAE